MPAIVGAYARVEAGQRAEAIARLEALAGVTPFELGDPALVGILVEAESLEAAHERITGPVRAVPGLLTCWPVYAHTGDEGEGT